MNKQTMIEHLNDDLAGELSAIIQYLTYAAKATGPYRPQLAQFFLTEVADEQLHAQFLANKIVALGGEPVTIARPVTVAKTNREMLEAVLTAERRATVVNPATLQPCNPVIFTSGNMPAGTDNDENRTLIPQMHADQH
jgi:bacterioferritin (cytochrome b1)